MHAVEVFGVRLRRVRRTSVDAVVGTALAVAAVAIALNQDESIIAILALGLLAVTVIFRNRAPEAACAAAIIAATVFQQTGSAIRFPIAAIAIVLDYYALGSRIADRGPALVDVALTLIPVGAIMIGPDGSSAAAVITVWLFFGGLPLTAGWAIGRRRRLTSRLRAANAVLKLEREERAKLAAGEERVQVSRELHDVVAHNLTVMVIQAAAARNVAGRDREAARGALEAVERSGREALAEMRRLVGVLRRGEDNPGITPSLSHLGALVEQARGAGLDVALRVDGTQRALPPGVDLAAFRIVQEALTNVIRHANTRHADLHLLYGERYVELEIADSGSGTRPGALTEGHGLAGMRERVALYGGKLTTSARTGGGFVVSGWIPTAGVEGS